MEPVRVNRKLESFLKRPHDMGILMVVGGPGGSGSTTIAQLLARHFKLSYFYAGKLMQKFSKNAGFENFNTFLKSDKYSSEIENFDQYVDSTSLKLSNTPNILIEGKAFAAITHIKKVPSTCKIWLDADIDVRTKRALWSKLKVPTSQVIDVESELYISTKKDLIARFEKDKERYKTKYSIQYDHPELYNDIVIDTSKMNSKDTFSLILELIRDGKYLPDKRK